MDCALLLFFVTLHLVVRRVNELSKSFIALFLKTRLEEYNFEDDIALLAHSEGDMQTQMNI